MSLHQAKESLHSLDGCRLSRARELLRRFRNRAHESRFDPMVDEIRMLMLRQDPDMAEFLGPSNEMMSVALASALPDVTRGALVCRLSNSFALLGYVFLLTRKLASPPWTRRHVQMTRSIIAPNARALASVLRSLAVPGADSIARAVRKDSERVVALMVAESAP